MSNFEKQRESICKKIFSDEDCKTIDCNFCLKIRKAYYLKALKWVIKMLVKTEDKDIYTKIYQEIEDVEKD